MSEDSVQVDSLLPYDHWTEEALRQVVASALDHVSRHGLPGDHHFYLTFRTDHPGVQVPGHLKARYPQEMTIVLQHQFWDLRVEAARFSVGLSFGGVRSTLVVPFAALSAFADPHVKYGLRFQPPEPAPAAAEPVAAAAAPIPAEAAAEPRPQVVSLDAFRRRPARD